MNDQPQCPLERAVWWAEHVLRQGGAGHLRSPTANITWHDYLEIEVLAVVSAFLTTVCVITIWSLRRVFGSACACICMFSNVKLKGV